MKTRSNHIFLNILVVASMLLLFFSCDMISLDQFKSNTVNVNSSNSNYGSVSPASTTVTGGTELSIKATPEEGYSFIKWSGDHTGGANPAEFIVNNDMNIAAEFGPAKWTVLVHFSIDNDIDYSFERESSIVSNYLETLEAIEANDYNDSIDIVVLMDCYNMDSNGNGYSSYFDDGYYHLTGRDFSDDLMVDISEINSGDLSETKAFMDWAYKNYPGSNYMYSIFNHGMGFDDRNIQGTYSIPTNRGIGFDDSHSDALSHNELDSATAYLKKLIGKNIDLFYTFACLMGGVEMAYEVKDNVDYLLFSEESFPADYWSYEALEAITYNPSISGEDLGVAFCDSAYDYFKGYRGFTLSLVDTSKVDNLYDSLNTYGQIAGSSIGSSQTQANYFNTAAKDAFSMFGDYDIEHYYMDLGDYLSNIESNYNFSNSVRTAAGNVNDALDSAVVYNTQYDYPEATGLTIFHNIWDSVAQYSLSAYRNILDFGNNDWVDYLTVMADFSGGSDDGSNDGSNDGSSGGSGGSGTSNDDDIYEPDDTAGNGNPITINAAPQNHTLESTYDIDWIYFYGYAGEYYVVDVECENDLVDMYLYIDGGYKVPVDRGWENKNLYINCEESRYYYIEVIYYNGGYSADYTGGIGSYSIGVSNSTSNIEDIYEPDDAPWNDTTIKVGEAQNHKILSSDDVDWLEFQGFSGDRYTIQASSSKDILNMYLLPVNNYENFIEVGWVGNNITFMCEETGLYHIKVEPHEQSTGAYTIELGYGNYSQHTINTRN